MKLRYSPIKNFGDALNPWLWPRLLPGMFDSDDGIHFWGIGSGLTWSRIRHAAKTHVIFGTGAGYVKTGFSFMQQFPWRVVSVRTTKNSPAYTLKDHFKSFRVYCVRGPLTARVMGLDDNLAVIDPAVLVKKVPLPHVEPDLNISFMPHFRTAVFSDYEDLCADLSVEYIDPRNSVDTVIDKIRRTRLLITEALHGAVVADAFRVPWIPVVSSDRILCFKWEDYCASVGLTYHPVRIQPLLNASRILSSNTVPGYMTLCGPAAKALVSARAWHENRKYKDNTLESLISSSKISPNLCAEENLAKAIERLEVTLDRFKRDAEAGMFESEY